MKNTTLKAMLVAGLSCLGATIAHAHRVWILPSTTVLSGTDQWVSVEAAVSNNLFFPNHRAVALTQVDVRDPDGQPVELKNATGGQIRSSFELQLAKQGTYIISLKPSQGRGGAGSGMGPGGPGAPSGPGGPGGAPAGVPPAKGGQGGPGGGGPGGGQGNLMGTYEENGQTKRWRGTEETLVSEGMASKPGFKLVTSGGRKTLTFVTVGNPTTANLKPEGKGLELEYLTHPNDLVTGEAASFRVLVDGKPAEAAEFTYVLGDDRFRNDAGEVTTKVGADSIVKIDWPKAGRYWVEVTASSMGQLHGVPQQKSFTYIVTLEVLPH